MPVVGADWCLRFDRMPAPRREASPAFNGERPPYRIHTHLGTIYEYNGFDIKFDPWSFARFTEHTAAIASYRVAYAVRCMVGGDRDCAVSVLCLCCVCVCAVSVLCLCGPCDAARCSALIGACSTAMVRPKWGCRYTLVHGSTRMTPRERELEAEMLSELNSKHSQLLEKRVGKVFVRILDSLSLSLSLSPPPPPPICLLSHPYQHGR